MSQDEINSTSRKNEMASIRIRARSVSVYGTGIPASAMLGEKHDAMIAKVAS